MSQATQSTKASVVFAPSGAARRLPAGEVDGLGFFASRRPTAPIVVEDGAYRTSTEVSSPVLSASSLDLRAWSSLIAARWGSGNPIPTRSTASEPAAADVSVPEVLLLDTCEHDSSDVTISDDWRRLSRWVEQSRPAAAELYPRELAARIDTLDSVIDRDLIDTLFAVVHLSADAGDEQLDRRDFLHGAQEHAVLRRVFYARLGWFDDILSRNEFILGDRFTDVDAHLFGVLLTFDIGYRNAFPVPDAAIVDYPHLWEYAKRIYAIEGLVSDADRRAIGLLPQADGTYAAPWGAPAFTETVDDIRAAWNV